MLTVATPVSPVTRLGPESEKRFSWGGGGQEVYLGVLPESSIAPDLGSGEVPAGGGLRSVTLCPPGVGSSSHLLVMAVSDAGAAPWGLPGGCWAEAGVGMRMLMGRGIRLRVAAARPAFLGAAGSEVGVSSSEPVPESVSEARRCSSLEEDEAPEASRNSRRPCLFSITRRARSCCGRALLPHRSLADSEPEGSEPVLPLIKTA